MTTERDSETEAERNSTTSASTATGRTDDERLVVGLMAGTSLDGVDAACCRVRRVDPESPFGYEVDVESFVTERYPERVRDRLVELCDDETGRVDEVCRLDRALGVLLADAARSAIGEAGVDADEVTAIGSHGQTVWHVPDPEPFEPAGRSLRSTLQIGDGATIARETGVVTVSDFRTADVAAGGHGAPLAPFLDVTTFAAADESRALQNVGGIGNCTIVPADPDRDEVAAFDTGPGNMVIDAVVELISDGARTYDRDGRQAAAGEASDDLVASFLDHPYFEEAPPKTTGRELFGHGYARRFVEAGRERGLSDDDLVASATALTARSIADAYDRFAEPYPEAVYVSGGGAHNDTLVSLLRSELSCSVRRLDDLGMDPDSKEAALFALLAATRLDRVPNTIPSATGADEAVVMGKVSEP